jgi:lysozyme family protein
VKVSYALEKSHVKLAFEMLLRSRGHPVSDSDSFVINADGSATVVADDELDVVAPTGATIPGTPTIASPGNFDKAFAFVIKWEGSDYEDVPGDPGGPTKFGVDTKDDASDLPPGVALKDLTLDQAKAIYLAKYWNGSDCPNLPSPVAETHFNYAVNVGASRSIRFMQAALHLTQDGQFGTLTQAALARATPGPIALAMVDAADAYYGSLTSEAKFLKGWLNRNNDLRAFIKTL